MKESKIFSKQNLAEKVHYVYRVTIDDKYYIGKRTGRLNDLETGVYKTSSKLVQEKLKNGHHFSKIKILQVFSSTKDALEFEKRILTRINAKTNKKFLNQSNGGGENFCLKQHTEKSKKKMSKSQKEYFNTKEGRKNRENRKNLTLKQFDINTEQGRKRREIHSEKMKEYFNPETEQGRLHLQENRRRGKECFNSNTEEGIKNRENMSKIKIEFYKTERGMKNRENHSKIMKENGKIIAQKRAETLIQKRKDTCILGELMFNEAFIRENFFITDDKNNPRFLSSVYSKLSGYSRSHIKVHKRNGKLSFLSGITSISISEEYENAKIKEIEQLLKSRNEKE